MHKSMLIDEACSAMQQMGVFQQPVSALACGKNLLAILGNLLHKNNLLWYQA